MLNICQKISMKLWNAKLFLSSLLLCSRFYAVATSFSCHFKSVGEKHSLWHQPFFGWNDDAVKWKDSRLPQKTLLSAFYFLIYSCWWMNLFQWGSRVHLLFCLFSLFYHFYFMQNFNLKSFPGLCLSPCQEKCCSISLLPFKKLFFFGPWLLICRVTIEQKCICGLKFSLLSTEAFAIFILFPFTINIKLNFPLLTLNNTTESFAVKFCNNHLLSTQHPM